VFLTAVVGMVIFAVNVFIVPAVIDPEWTNSPTSRKLPLLL
jgi:hypothetical protein